jgi:cytochrome c-type biogenesis protein CcmF
VQIRVVHQPLIVWLWTGGALMAFGSLLAAFPGKRRNPTDPVSAPVAAGGSPPPDPDPDPDLVPVGAGA